MTKGQTPTGQDWAPQVYNVHKSGGADARPKAGEKASNQALQSGGSIDVSKKMTSGNVNHSGPGKNAKKLDDDHENLKHKQVDHNLRANIQKGRQLKNWNQTEFAQKIAERPSVVQEYENGKAIPNEQVLVRMEKALGLHLRGAKAMEPMEPKKTKKQLAEEKLAKEKEENKDE